MSRKTIRQMFVLFFCLALAAPLAFGQEPKTPSLDAAQKQDIVDEISTLLTATLFVAEGLEYFRVEFVVKDGKAVELVGLYDDKRREPSPRTK
jgi:hypothetical protein